MVARASTRVRPRLGGRDAIVHGTIALAGQGTQVLVGSGWSASLLWTPRDLDLPGACLRESRRRAMTDNVVQSFCERCGTRFTQTVAVEQACPGHRRARAASDGGRSESESTPVDSAALPISEVFRDTFHFCLGVPPLQLPRPAGTSRRATASPAARSPVRQGWRPLIPTPWGRHGPRAPATVRARPPRRAPGRPMIWSAAGRMRRPRVGHSRPREDPLAPPTSPGPAGSRGPPILRAGSPPSTRGPRTLSRATCRQRGHRQRRLRIADRTCLGHPPRSPTRGAASCSRRRTGGVPSPHRPQSRWRSPHPPHPPHQPSRPRSRPRLTMSAAWPALSTARPRWTQPGGCAPVPW